MEKETEKKKEIRSLAISMFREKGFDNVTVNDLSAAAGISKNTFYYYFDSKEDIILDLFCTPPVLQEDVLVSLMGIDDPFKQLMVLYGRLCDFYTEYGREIVRKALEINLTHRYMPDTENRKGELSGYEALIKKVYENGIARNEIRNDVEIWPLVGTSLILLTGCLQIWVTSGKDFDLKEMYLKRLKMLIGKQGIND
jgi:hypothetical protein